MGRMYAVLAMLVAAGCAGRGEVYQAGELREQQRPRYAAETPVHTMWEYRVPVVGLAQRGNAFVSYPNGYKTVVTNRPNMELVGRLYGIPSIAQYQGLDVPGKPGVEVRSYDNDEWVSRQEICGLIQKYQPVPAMTQPSDEGVISESDDESERTVVGQSEVGQDEVAEGLQQEDAGTDQTVDEENVTPVTSAGD